MGWTYTDASGREIIRDGEAVGSPDTGASYRETVRKTLQGLSDQALATQDRVVIGGIDREEVDREIARREN